MNKADTPIEYMYLNMDTKKFVDTQTDLVKQLRPGSLLRALASYNHNQVLIAGGIKHFTEFDAKFTCQRLTGVLKR